MQANSLNCTVFLNKNKTSFDKSCDVPHKSVRFCKKNWKMIRITVKQGQSSPNNYTSIKVHNFNSACITNMFLVSRPHKNSQDFSADKLLTKAA